MTDTHAAALDALTVHIATSRLIDRFADSVEEPIDGVFQHLRVAHGGFKFLCDVEKRNVDIAARDAADGWTRLATMAPFHPDDQAMLEERMARHREVVLEQGRRQGREEGQGREDGQGREEVRDEVERLADD